MVCLFLKSLPDLYRGDWLQTTPGKIPRSCKAKSPLNLLLFSGKSLQYCWLSTSFILIYSIGKLKAHGLHFSPIGIWNGQQLYLLWVNAQSFQLGLTLCDPMGCSLPGSSIIGFSRQEYWSGSSYPLPRDLPKLGGTCVSYVSFGGFFTSIVSLHPWWLSRESIYLQCGRRGFEP